MNEVIDLAFIAAKVAAMKDEKARMIVGGVSLVYNVSQIARFKAMIVEFLNYATTLFALPDLEDIAHKKNII